MCYGEPQKWLDFGDIWVWELKLLVACTVGATVFCGPVRSSWRPFAVLRQSLVVLCGLSRSPLRSYAVLCGHLRYLVLSLIIWCYLCQAFKRLLPEWPTPITTTPWAHCCTTPEDIDGVTIVVQMSCVVQTWKNVDVKTTTWSSTESAAVGHIHRQGLAEEVSRLLQQETSKFHVSASLTACPEDARGGQMAWPWESHWCGDAMDRRNTRNVGWFRWPLTWLRTFQSRAGLRSWHGWLLRRIGIGPKHSGTSHHS